MKKILIVEDDKKIAQLEQAYLEMSGYETFCVYDGADVEAEAEKNQYDLILLDLMLPNCSGHTICENLRKSRIFRSSWLLHSGNRLMCPWTWTWRG